MKIKLDECIPCPLADILATHGHDVHTVHQELLTGASDSRIWEAAQDEQRFLGTTDLDFSDVRIFSPGSHGGILLIRLAREGQQSITALVEWLLANHDIESWRGAMVIASDHKLRIRKPS